MKIFLLALAVVGVAVFLLCFNIIFRNKPFPDGEISRNAELRRRGIICAGEEEKRLHGRKNRTRPGTCGPEACSECSASCSIKENR